MEHDRFCGLLGACVSRETFFQLVGFVQILLKWQEKLNLISKESIPTLWERHVVDSAQLLHFLPQEGKIVDLGSGGGFPGIVLSILRNDDVILLEKDERKATFLRHVSRVLSLKTKVICQRIETVDSLHSPLITSRALTSLNHLMAYMQHLGTDSVQGYFLKGKTTDEEVSEAAQTWIFNVEKFPSRTDQSGVIIKISSLIQRKGEEDDHHSRGQSKRGGW